MCTVSYVGVQGWDRWNPNPFPYTPPTISVYPPVPTKEELEAFYELVRKARLYDKIKGKSDCVKPDIDAWLAELETRLDEQQEELDSKLSADDLVEAIRIGLTALGLPVAGLEDEL